MTNEDKTFFLFSLVIALGAFIAVVYGIGVAAGVTAFVVTWALTFLVLTRFIHRE